MSAVRSQSNRRDFSKLLLGGAAGWSLSSDAFGQDAVSATKLTDSVALLTGAGSNVLAVIAPDGLLLVDGGLAAHAAALAEALKALAAERPVRVLFNTHWHAEQTGFNEAAAKAGAKIVAHEYTKQYLGIDVYLEWQNRTYQPLPKSAWPNETFRATGKMTFGGEAIEYGHLGQAHTDGDIYVFLPGPNILITGDVISVGKYPILDYSSNGWIRGMANANKTLIDMANAQTRVIPGQGAVQDRAYMDKQHEMLTTMLDRMIKMIRMGYGASDMLAEGATKGYDADWGDPELFIKNAYRGMWGHVRELGGIV